MDSFRYSVMKKFIVLLLFLSMPTAEARTVNKSVTVRDTKETTLTELDRFLNEAQGAINDNATREICWHWDGIISALTDVMETRADYPFDFLPLEVRMHVLTAPTGASLIIDINDDGSTIFSTRPEIDAGATEEDGNHVFTQSEIAAGSDISLDVDQVGSTESGRDLTVCIYGRT